MCALPLGRLIAAASQRQKGAFDCFAAFLVTPPKLFLASTENTKIISRKGELKRLIIDEEYNFSQTFRLP